MTEENKVGYHISSIIKGKLGESSKIQEELDELIDAEKQGIKILQLCELADLLGAIEAYLEMNKFNMTIKDLYSMSSATKRSFLSGERK